MKWILFYLIAVATSVYGAEIDPVARPHVDAEELAYHLGCKAWASQFRLADRSLTVEILAIRDGKVREVVLSSAAHPTDRTFTGIAIIAGPTATLMPLSLQIEAAPSPRKQINEIKLDYHLPLPSVLLEGEYVLGGTPFDPTAFEKLDLKEITPEQFKEGLLLKVK